MQENKNIEIEEKNNDSKEKVGQNNSSTKVKPVLTEKQIKQRRNRKTKGAVAAFILILGIGVMGNWYYQNSDLSSTIEPLISSKQTKTLGEAEYVDATTEFTQTDESEYFAKARVDRQTARDNALDTLKDSISSSDEDDKSVATEKIAEISNHISIENKIETLVMAKGVKSCLAVINDDSSRVDVIVDVDELTDEIILQIKEIATEQVGCDYKNVSIIQANK